MGGCLLVRCRGAEFAQELKVSIIYQPLISVLTLKGQDCCCQFRQTGAFFFLKNLKSLGHFLCFTFTKHVFLNNKRKWIKPHSPVANGPSQGSLIQEKQMENFYFKRRRKKKKNINAVYLPLQLDDIRIFTKWMKINTEKHIFTAQGAELMGLQTAEMVLKDRMSQTERTGHHHLLLERCSLLWRE